MGIIFTEFFINWTRGVVHDLSHSCPERTY